MNAVTLKALKGSIRKWEKVVEGTGLDRGVVNCPLCTLFRKNDCYECPVKEEVGLAYCTNTPHEEWIAHQDTHTFPEDGFTVRCVKCKKLARKELKFLRSLLPKGVQDERA